MFLAYQTVPALNAWERKWAFLMSVVQMDAPNPYLEELALSATSSRLLNF